METHFAVPVKNLEKSKLFYEKLGFKVFAQWEKPNQNLKAIKMRSDEYNCHIELVHHADNDAFLLPKMVEVLHIGLQVSNIETKLKKLEGEGTIPIVPITKGVSVKQFAFLRDPNGFPIELVEYRA